MLSIDNLTTLLLGFNLEENRHVRFEDLLVALKWKLARSVEVSKCLIDWDGLLRS